MSRAPRFSAAALLALGAVFASAPPARAYPVHTRLATEAFGKKVSCELCHGYGGGTERTAYGMAWQKNGENLESFRRIDAFDSDQDGFANRAEIDANSNPGDKRSTPAEPGRYATRINKIFIPKEQLDLVLGKVERVEAMEATLTPAQVLSIEKAIGRKLLAAERYPTLYFGVQDGKRIRVALFAYAERGSKHYSLLVGLGLDGEIDEVAMFRAGEDTGSVFRPYLRCLATRSKDTLPKGELVPCELGKDLKPRTSELQQITSAVHAALWTVWTLFAKG